MTNVEKKSHEEAYRRSYMVEVQDRASFDLVMSGSVLPPDVGVRQWRSGKKDKKQAATRGGASWPAATRPQDRDSMSSVSSVSSSQD